MTTFYLSGTYTVKQEATFSTEIEADTPEQAAQKFNEIAKTNSFWQHAGEPSNDYFDLEGNVDVYASESARDDWQLDEALVEAHEFTGYK